MADVLTGQTVSHYSAAQHGHVGALPADPRPAQPAGPEGWSPAAPRVPYAPPPIPAAAQPVSWPPTPTGAAYGDVAAFENTSGMDSTVPPEIAQLKWSWGASCLTWIWLCRHGLQGYGLLTFFSQLFAPLAVIGSLYLGSKGHELAWRHRRYESLEQFFAVERAWANWGIGINIAGWLAIAVVALALHAAS